MTMPLLELMAAIVARPGEALKPAWTQLREIARLKVRRNIGPRYYFAALLNRAEVTFDDAAGHINENEYLAFIERINPAARRRPYDSKIFQKQLLAASGVPTPGVVFSIEGRTADAVALAEALRPLDGTLVAIKPAASSGGRGFRAVKVRVDGGAVALVEQDTGSTVSLDALVASMANGFVAEAYVQQHSWYARLNETSVNTWRIWAMKRGTGDTEILLAYLRMGRAQASVDNMSAGGLYAPLLDDDTLGPVQDGTIYRRSFAAHPDSGCRILGVKPPFVDDAKAIAARALDAMPDLAFAGVDVAVTPDGPTVIEINAEPDRMGAARTGLPFATWLSEHGLL